MRKWKEEFRRGRTNKDEGRWGMKNEKRNLEKEGVIWRMKNEI
jgi:hypothetical protein